MEPTWDGRELALGLTVSLLVGALVGLERERHAALEERAALAGIRTFPLIALAGALSALAAGGFGPFAFLAGFLFVASLTVVSYWGQLRESGKHPGTTSEMAAVIVFLVGALPFAAGLDAHGLGFEMRIVAAAALGAVVMALLALREPLHALAGRFSEEDLHATVRFVLLVAVVLPLLPDRNLGPYGALNPRAIGFVIVLIAALSFVGYFAVRVLGPRRGITLTGLFGGLASSTAVTLTFSARGRSHPALANACALAIVLASTVMFVRLLVEVAVLRRPLLVQALPAIGTMLAVAALGSVVVAATTARRKATQVDEPEFKNPFSLKEALRLGALFAVVRVVAAAAHAEFGAAGLHVSAALAGLTDVDAITVSIAGMHAAGLDDAAAVTALVLAAGSNTLAKTGIALVAGGFAVGRVVALVLVPAAAAGLAVAALA